VRSRNICWPRSSAIARCPSRSGSGRSTRPVGQASDLAPADPAPRRYAAPPTVRVARRVALGGTRPATPMRSASPTAASGALTRPPDADGEPGRTRQWPPPPRMEPDTPPITASSAASPTNWIPTCGRRRGQPTQSGSYPSAMNSRVVSAAASLRGSASWYSGEAYQARAVAQSGNSKTTNRSVTGSPSTDSIRPPRTL
jgi:hypothetical protein